MADRRHTTSLRTFSRLVCALVPLLAVEAAAQEDASANPTFGYEYGVPLSLQRAPGFINRYGFEGTGTSYNHTASFGADLFMPRAIDERMDMAMRLTLALSTGRFTSDPFETSLGIDEGSGMPIIANNVFEVYSSLSVVQIDLRTLYRFDERWRLGAGMWGSYRFSSAFFQTESIVNSATTDVRFPDGSTKRTVSSGQDLGSYPFRFGPIVSIATDLPLFSRLALRPELHARVDVEALSKGLGLRSVGVGVNLSLLLNTPGQRDTGVAPPVLAENGARGDGTAHTDGTAPEIASMAGRHRLEAAIDLYCGAPGNDHPCAINARRALHRQYVTLPPAIFFERGSTGIPARYTLLGRDSASSFTLESLARLGERDLYYHLLNIIALRLRKLPAARITLEGAAGDGEPAALAAGRAETVRSYLVDVWGIDRSRITVENGGRRNAGSREAGPSVSITTTHRSILGPVITAWIVNDFALPPIGLSRTIDAGAGVRGWTISIRQGEEELARYSSDDSAAADAFDLSFLNTSGSAVTLPPLVAELTVEDFSGRTVTARDQLTLAFDRNTTRRDGGTEEIVTYILPSSIGSGRSLDSLNRQALRGLASRVLDGARVDIAHAGTVEENGGEPLIERILGALSDASERIDELHVTRATEPGGWSAEPEAKLFSTGARITITQERPDTVTNNP